MACPYGLLQPCSVPRQDFLFPSFRSGGVKACAPPGPAYHTFLKGDPGGLELRILKLCFLLVRKMFPDGASRGEVGDFGERKWQN